MRSWSSGSPKSPAAPAFARLCARTDPRLASNDTAIADGLLAWLAGQPNVSASVKRSAGVKGDIDHFGALSFLQGLLVVLRDSGHAGLVLVLDEVETLQRVRGDVREKGLNALRQLIDEVDSGRFPGLYLVITGTPAFFEARKESSDCRRWPSDFTSISRPTPGSTTLGPCRFARCLRPRQALRGRLKGARHLHGALQRRRTRPRERRRSIHRRAGVSRDRRLGGKVGIAPRVFLKKLVADVLDRIDQFEEFDPRKHYALTIAEGELTPSSETPQRGQRRRDRARSVTPP